MEGPRDLGFTVQVLGFRVHGLVLTSGFLVLGGDLLVGPRGGRVAAFAALAVHEEAVSGCSV